MFHQNVATVITQEMLLYRKLLQAYVVLKHLSKVNCNRLTDCLVNRVFDIKFLQCVVRAVQH